MCVLLGAAAILAAHAARAQPALSVAAPPPPVAVVAPGAGCPSAAAVARALGEIMPEVRSVDPTDPDALVVQVVDRGDHYRVVAAAQSRELFDPARQCRERARASAVVVALTLRPPGVEQAAPPPLAAVADAEQPGERALTLRRRKAPEVATPTSPWDPSGRLTVELSGAIAMAPGDGAGAGVTLRAAAGGRLLALALGVELVEPLTLSRSVVAVELTRLPVDLDVRARLGRGRLEGLVELGVLAAWLHLRGPDAGGDRLDLGVRAAGQARVWLWPRLAALAGVELAYELRPYDLLVEGHGVVGQTPDTWIGLSVGIATRFE
jgi:hypothetical protein